MKIILNLTKRSIVFILYQIVNIVNLLKKILNRKKIINCDKYVETLRERDNFYNFIQKYTKIPYKYFPMIFKNGEFIGGYKEFLDFNLKTNHQ